MEGPGLGRRGGRPACFSPVLLFSVVDKRGILAKGRPLPPVFQFLLTHSEGWGARFLAAVAGCMGVSEGNATGEIFPRA